MRRKLVIVAVLLQLLALAGMAGKRETIHAYGERIYLRSAPLDPYDPFRGDFVRLNYSALSTVKGSDIRGTLAERQVEKGILVYAVLKPGENELYSLDYLTDKKPEQGLFLKGYTTTEWRFTLGDNIGVKYGIEQYFVQQGKGLEMEKKLGSRNELQIPIEMQIAVGGDGTAIITGYRWSQLGVQLEVMRINNRQLNNPQINNQVNDQPTETPLSPAVKVTLKNVSDQPLTLANPGDNCAFELIWVSNSNNDYQLADNRCAQTTLTTSDLIQLKPDESYAADIDLSQPRWHIRYNDQTREIGAIDGWQQFRLVYRSPEKNQTERFIDAPFWLGELPTPAFNGSGRVD